MKQKNYFFFIKKKKYINVYLIAIFIYYLMIRVLLERIEKLIGKSINFRRR